MSEVNWWALLLSIALFSLLGVAAQSVAGVSWLGVGALLQGLAWALGLWASEDSAWPGDEDYEHARGSEQYESHLRAIRLHQVLISVALAVSAVGFLYAGGGLVG